MSQILSGLVAAGLLMLPGLAAAQDRDDPEPVALRLDDFRLASPPALALIGVAPASVERPNTPRALIASLVSATGSSGVVPNGFAMETAPYWLARHPMLQLRDYFNPSPGDRLKYFTAISVATARPKARSEAVNPDAHVSIAVRTLLANGHPSPALVNVTDQIRKSQLDYINAYTRWEIAKQRSSPLDAQRRKLAREDLLLSSLVTRVLVGPERELRDSTLRTLARRDSARAAVAQAENAGADVERLEKGMDALEAKLSDLAEKFTDEDLEPDGFILEFAAGTRAKFVEGEWSHQRVDGLGVWITPMYRLSAQQLEIIAVARYLTRVADYENRNLLDIGGRLSRDIGKGSFGAELTNRNLSDKGGSSTRWAAIFSVPLPAKLQLLGSFGSDFRRSDGKRPVIATLGINLGVGAIMIAPSSRRNEL